MKPKVYVTRLLPEVAMQRISSFCDAEVWEGELPPSREMILEKVRDVEGRACLLTDKIDAEVMSEASNLRVISNYAAGFDNIDIVEAVCGLRNPECWRDMEKTGQWAAEQERLLGLLSRRVSY